VRVERAQRAGGEMPCHDNLGSIPNQSSRLDAAFGIHIKSINSTMGDPRKKAFKFIQKQRPLDYFEEQKGDQRVPFQPKGRHLRQLNSRPHYVCM